MVYSSLDPVKVIVFEDISKLGYKMISKNYLERSEFDSLLKKICRWHAISFKLIKEGDESIIRLKEGVFNLEQGMDVFFGTSIKGFADLIKDPQFDPIYSEKFETIKDTLIEKCKNIYKHQGDLCVLNHGDFHIKNMMYKIDANGKIEDLMLLDFQFCVTAPLIIDLIYFFYAIPDPNCKNIRDEIIYKYHKLFVEILDKIGYKGKVPTVAEINMEVMRYKELEVIMVVAFFPFMCAIHDKVEMDNELMEKPEFLLNFYNRPTYIKHLKELLPGMLQKGYFD